MKKQYLIRLDDACPTMNHEKWGRMESILDKYGIKPMVGIIPHNEDKKQEIDPFNNGFWSLVHSWEKKGWALALHGYNHVYSSTEGGMNPIWNKSEFAGLDLSLQKDKIRLGLKVFNEQGLTPKYFFAPSHTFDEVTLDALREESEIRIISDTIAIKPFKYKDFIFIPQFSGECREMTLNGVFTFCFHPNTMDESLFKKAEGFFHAHRDMFTSFDAIDLSKVKNKSVFDRLLSCGYFTIRRIKSNH